MIQRVNNLKTRAALNSNSEVKSKGVVKFGEKKLVFSGKCKGIMHDRRKSAQRGGKGEKEEQGKRLFKKRLYVGKEVGKGNRNLG